MGIEYEGKTWNVSPTRNDANSFFHAAFGTRNADDESYVEKIAQTRRTHFVNFLGYYEDKPRPVLLKDTLKDCFEIHGWSGDADGDFKEYIKYAGQDRQILPDELPLLAGLENIRIVLFVDDDPTPKIVDPITEILGDYPLVNTSSVETVVMVFRDSTYSKLTPQNPEPVGEEKEESVVKHRKRPLGIISGIWYEINLLSIVLLNALKKYDTWRLSSNVAEASYFDDLVFEWGPTNSVFLLQARWRKKIVRKSDFLGGKYSGFSLAKYFFAYEKIKDSLKISNVVLCTNTSIKFEDLAIYINMKNLTEDHLLYFEGVKSICYTFKEEITPILLQNFRCYDGIRYPVTEENVKSFLKSFQIISLYPKGKTLEQAIESGIERLGVSRKHDSTDYARHLNRKIMEWYDETEKYLTPLYAKVIFCELRSNRLLGKLHNLDLVLKPDRMHITVSKRITHIVPQDNNALTLLKVSKLLGNEEPETLFLSTSETAYNQKMMVEAFEYRQYNYLVFYKTTHVEDVQGLCDEIVRILNEFSNKKVILIADKQDELATALMVHDESIFETLEDNVMFTDLTEASQERLLEKAILFYEASL